MIPDILLPQGMTELVFAVLLATSFAGSFITASVGIGGGAMLLAIMASLVPPAALIPAHGVIQIGSNLGRGLVMFRHIHWPALPAFAAGSVIGAAAGGAIAVSLPPAWVQIGIGLFIAWSVLGRPPRGMRDWPLLVGIGSSFLTMFFGATGPFVAIFAKAQNLARHSHVATQAALMSVQHGVKTVTFGLLGFAFGAWWPFLIAMIAAGFMGTLAGRQMLNRLNETIFRRALDTMLLLLAVHLVWNGLRGL